MLSSTSLHKLRKGPFGLFGFFLGGGGNSM